MNSSVCHKFKKMKFFLKKSRTVELKIWHYQNQEVVSVFSIYKHTLPLYKLHKVLILDWSSMIIFKLFTPLCITGYFYEVLSDCTQLHICALTSVNTIKIFKNECVMSVNLSVPFCSLISVRHIIYAWGLFSSSSCSRATGWYYPRPHIFWVFTACLCMYVCMYVCQVSLNRDLACVKTSAYTEQTQTQRKFRQTFIPWVEFEPIIPLSKEEKTGHTLMYFFRSWFYNLLDFLGIYSPHRARVWCQCNCHVG